MPSDWSHPFSQQPKRSVASTAAAAPRDQPVSRSQNPNIPVAAPAGESKSVTQPADNIRNNVALNAIAFTENEEFGLFRPNPTSPAGATGQVGPRPRASQTDGLARQGPTRAASGRGEERRTNRLPRPRSCQQGRRSERHIAMQFRPPEIAGVLLRMTAPDCTWHQVVVWRRIQKRTKAIERAVARQVLTLELCPKADVLDGRETIGA